MEEKTIHRIKQFIDSEGISMNAFDTAIGAANGYINKMFKAEGSVGENILQKILAAFPEIDPLWLLTGKKNTQTGGILVATDTTLPHVSHKNAYKNEGTQSHSVTDSVTNLKQTGTFKGKKPVIPYGTEPSIPMYMEDKSAPYGGQCQECLIKDEKIKDQAHIIAALAGQIEALKLATSQMKARLQPQATRKGKK